MNPTQASNPPHLPATTQPGQAGHLQQVQYANVGYSSGSAVAPTFAQHQQHSSHQQSSLVRSQTTTTSTTTTTTHVAQQQQQAHVQEYHLQRAATAPAALPLYQQTSSRYFQQAQPPLPRMQQQQSAYHTISRTASQAPIATAPVMHMPQQVMLQTQGQMQTNSIMQQRPAIPLMRASKSSIATVAQQYAPVQQTRQHSTFAIAQRQVQPQVSSLPQHTQNAAPVQIQASMQTLSYGAAQAPVIRQATAITN